MVRKVDISSTVGPSTAAQLWNAAYAEAGPTKAYHALVNKDPEAEVEPWKEGVRHVTFSMPLAAPDWVKRSVGIDAVRVRETQMVLWHNSNSFTVRSDTTVLNVPGAARFHTALMLSITERTEAAEDEEPPATVCDVVFTVKCSAGMPWPLSGSIENIMAERATESMQGYLTYCQELVERKPGDPIVGVALPSMADRTSDPGVGPPEGRDRQASRSILGHRTARWPSVTVSNFPQGVDELLPMLPEGELLTNESSPGGAAEYTAFQDATEAWLSPAASFSGNASDDGQGAMATPAAAQRRRRHVTAPVSVAPVDANAAAVVAELQGLAKALLVLDNKVTYLASQVPPSPAVTSTASKWIWGKGNSKPADTSHRYQPAPDVESGRGGTSRACCSSARSFIYALWVAGRLLSVLLMLAGAWYLLLLARQATGNLPSSPSPAALPLHFGQQPLDQ